MGGPSNDPPEHNKHKGRSSFTEGNSSGASGSGTNPREPKHSSSNNGNNSNSWYEGRKDHRRDHNKVRDRSRDRDWSRDRDRSSRGRSRENFNREEEPRERFREDQQPPYPNYNYNAGTDPSYVDNNHRNFGMMPTYGLFPVNPAQWGMAPMDGITMNPPPVNMNPPPAGMNMNPPPAAMNMNPAEMNPNANANMAPYAFMGMPGDPNCYGMVGMGHFGQYGVPNVGENMAVAPQKEIIHLSRSVLYPPNPNAAPPTTRDKPPGCKTMFVGGLPENITDEIIREIFEKCGEIVTIRMSKKNFCHVRFSSENFLENAIYFSGYRIKIENKDDAPNTGRLHVDFAQARDDQYEFECLKRTIQREARHRERNEQEFYRPPTPPPIPHYSDHEAALLGEKLRKEETLQQGLTILCTWLDRGECNKKNAGTFYSLIQSAASHVRRIQNDNKKRDEDHTRVTMMRKQGKKDSLVQYSDIEKVLVASFPQKVWDHFTKPQRKNIEQWRKQAEETKKLHLDEILKDREEDEMDVSDGEGEVADNSDGAASTSGNNIARKDPKLQEESDSLRCQLEAAENELAVVKLEADQERELRGRQLESLHESLRNLQEDFSLYVQCKSKEEGEPKELRVLKLAQKDTKSEREKEVAEVASPEVMNEEDGENNTDIVETAPEADVQRDVLAFASSIASTSSSLFSGTQHEARLLCLISTFLNVHPFGASVDYICSFLHQIDSTVRARDVESLMRRFPSVFKEESTGIGASLEKKWTFCGFRSQE